MVGLFLDFYDANAGTYLPHDYRYAMNWLSEYQEITRVRDRSTYRVSDVTVGPDDIASLRFSDPDVTYDEHLIWLADQDLNSLTHDELIELDRAGLL